MSRLTISSHSFVFLLFFVVSLHSVVLSYLTDGSEKNYLIPSIVFNSSSVSLQSSNALTSVLSISSDSSSSPSFSLSSSSSSSSSSSTYSPSSSYSSPSSSPSSFQSRLTVTSSTRDPNNRVNNVQPPVDPVMSCYYGSWSVYRHGRGKFDVEDIDPFLCTHVIYAFAGLDESTGTIKSLDPYNDLYDNRGKGGYIRFTSLKRINPTLKTLLSIGGWREGSAKYSEMALTYTSRNTFIKSCVKFLLKFGFDGLDIDWEFPNTRGGRPEDKDNFGLLLQEMKSAFKPLKLMLTAAVSASKNTIDVAYNVTTMAKHLDLIFLMGYAFHGVWDKYAHHHAPLHAYHEDKGNSRFLNVDFAVRYWLHKRFPREKLVVGVGLHGICFTLASPDHHDVYSPAPMPGKPGPYTDKPGTLGFNELCLEEQQVTWTVVRDKDMVSPYAYQQKQWCGYDDVISAAAKARYILSLGLAGAMVWSIDMDDFQGDCKIDRHREIHENELNNYIKTVDEEIENDLEVKQEEVGGDVIIDTQDCYEYLGIRGVESIEAIDEIETNDIEVGEYRGEERPVVNETKIKTDKKRHYIEEKILENNDQKGNNIVLKNEIDGERKENEQETDNLVRKQTAKNVITGQKGNYDEILDELERKENDEETGRGYRFPLVSTIREVLRGGRPLPTPTPAPIYPPTTVTTTTTTTTTTTEPPLPPSKICHREGLNRDPNKDCTVFYICHQMEGRWFHWKFNCPLGTIFVEDMQVCDYPDGHEACPLLPPVTITTTTTTPTSTTTTGSTTSSTTNISPVIDTARQQQQPLDT